MSLKFTTLAAALSLLLLGGCASSPQSGYYGNNPGNQGYGTGGTSGTNSIFGVGPKKLFGTLGAAAAGGWAGAQIGGGTGNLAATAAGTLLGALVGSVVGGDLDDADAERARTAFNYSMQQNQPVTYQTEQGGGMVEPTRTGITESGTFCREFRHTILIGNEKKRGIGRACQNPDGSWQIVAS
jgi:surface antigen